MPLRGELQKWYHFLAKAGPEPIKPDLVCVPLLFERPFLGFLRQTAIGACAEGVRRSQWQGVP